MTHTKITPQIAALYLGALCEVAKAEKYWHEYTPKGGYKMLVTGDKLLVNGNIISLLATSTDFEITLHLRHLNSLTDAQAMECYNIFYEGQAPEMTIEALYTLSSKTLIAHGSNIHLGFAPIQNFLRSRGFDLDCLIEAGLAKQITP